MRPRSRFWEEVVLPTYEDCVVGLNLGFSPSELGRRNSGLAYEPMPALRDCPHFRWDQSVLNGRLAAAFPYAEAAGLEQYAGVRGPREHPEQVIWAHRRRGSLAYLARARYARETARRDRAFGLWYRWRWWVKLNDKYLRPTTYRLKAQATWRRLRERP
jgi:hypothetical protein